MSSDLPLSLDEYFLLILVAPNLQDPFEKQQKVQQTCHPLAILIILEVILWLDQYLLEWNLNFDFFPPKFQQQMET